MLPTKCNSSHMIDRVLLQQETRLSSLANLNIRAES